MEDVVLMRPDRNFWSGRSVLVTGANGFVGAWLTQRLLELRARVTVLVRDQRPSGGLRLLGLEPELTIALGSISDYGTVDRVLRQYRVETCFHLAAQALVGVARSSPLDTFQSNIAGTWTVLEACRQAGVAGVVVASSDKAYGNRADLPYVETQVLEPAHPYDASKACTDLLARSYARAYGMPVTVTRCANIYGGGDLHESRLFPDVILSVMAGKRPVLRSDGRLRRDFLYVDDAVDAYLRLGERVATPGIAGEAFNFGTGQPVAVRAVVDRILALMGREDLEPVIQNRLKPGEEIEAQYLDSGKAGRMLGWSPQIALDEGLRRTVSWYQRFFLKEVPTASTPSLPMRKREW